MTANREAAFPIATDEDVENWGMDLRDYFAGQVLHNVYDEDMLPEGIAMECYLIADAMMLEREKKWETSTGERGMRNG